MKSVESSTDTANNFQSLRKLEQKQQSEITTLQKIIEDFKNQLKNLSQSASKIIQKKLGEPKTSKSRPKLNPSFKSEKLQQKQDEKQKIYRQISETKELILSITQQQQPQIKAQILNKQIELNQIAASIQKFKSERKYLLQQLQANKQKISSIKESIYNKEYTENQKTLQQGKKQKAALQKKIYTLSQDQIQANIYFFELKAKLESQSTKTTQKQANVSIQQINKLHEQINQIIENRNQIENKKRQQIVNLIQEIQTLEKQKNQMENRFRQAQGQIMKKGLEQRFYRSHIQKISKSTDPFIQYSSIRTQNDKSSQLSIFSPNRTSQVKKSNQHKIEIGEQQSNQNTKILKDPTLLSEGLEKLSKISFFISENKVVGIKSLYLDKSGKKIAGQLLSIDKMQRTIQKQICVKDVKQIQYPIKSKNVSLKFIQFNGDVQNIGTQYYGPTLKYNITQKNIKSIDLVVQKDKEGFYSKVSGILINLIDINHNKNAKKIQDLELETPKKINKEKLFVMSAEGMPKKAQSVDNLSSIKKKLVLKPVKKQAEENLDHRLLIRRKLV